MKTFMFLLLALLSGASGPKLPTVRLTFTPLTRAAYEQARQQAPAPNELGRGEKPSFPIRKQKGRLVIPTAAGNKVFKDKIFPQNEVDDVTYEYLGFFPRHQQHLLVVHYYESSEVLLMETSGNVESLVSMPFYSPSQRRLAAASRGLVYPMMPNSLQLAEQVAGRTRVVWELTPKHWEPAQVFWTSDSTLCVKQELIDPATEEPFKPARFTYARLLVRPAAQ